MLLGPQTVGYFIHPRQKAKNLELSPCLACGKNGWIGSDVADIILRNPVRAFGFLNWFSRCFCAEKSHLERGEANLNHLDGLRRLPPIPYTSPWRWEMTKGFFIPDQHMDTWSVLWLVGHFSPFQMATSFSTMAYLFLQKVWLYPWSWWNPPSHELPTSSSGKTP